MARKNKRRAAARRAAQAPSRPGPQATPPPGTTPGRAPQTPSQQQRVEMSLGTQAGRPVRQGRARTARGTVVIPDTDPAIPLDQVPHFTSDLVRLLIVAAAMVALLIIGAQFIPFLVK
jgi:hypothetical protein